MAYKVIGITNYYGNYNGKDYNGYYLHVADLGFKETKGEKLISGAKCDKIKCTQSFINTLDYNLVDLTGHEIDVYYDKFGYLQQINRLK